MTPAFEKQLLDQVGRLDPEQQQRVFDFARALGKERKQGVAGAELLRFAGTIDSLDLAEMERVIEEDCEGVDRDE